MHRVGTKRSREAAGEEEGGRCSSEYKLALAHVYTARLSFVIAANLPGSEIR